MARHFQYIKFSTARGRRAYLNIVRFRRSGGLAGMIRTAQKRRGKSFPL